ncbi:MAG: response regulator [Lachnospiraceae bacterium]|nr:response regulator [Lachnospiraceae bacterium]
MNTLTVDDRELVVNSMLKILNELDPNGCHKGTTRPSDALDLSLDTPLDIAFLDIEIPGQMNGLTLGKKLKKLFPRLNIVIITGYREYAIDAFELDASGYLLKPVTQAAVAHQLSVLRFKNMQSQDRKIRVRCFGTFEIFYNNEPLNFSYSKSSELLACLIDHKGALCSNDTLIGCLWPDEPATRQTKSRLRKYVKDIKDTFAKLEISDVIRHQERIGIGLDISRIDCDYYRYLQGDPLAIHQFKGQYMQQYSFAEETRYELTHMRNV